MIPQIKGVTIPARYLDEYINNCDEAGVSALMSHKGEWATLVSVSPETEDDLIIEVRDVTYKRQVKTTKTMNEPVSVAVYEEVHVLR